MKKILTLLTNASTLSLTDGTSHPSGYWAEELAVPYEQLKHAGYRIDIATLGGVVPTVDKSSLDPDMIKWVRPFGSQADDAENVRRFKNTLESIEQLKAPLNVDTLKREELASYAGLYISGGHGTIEDMRASPGITRLLLTAQQLNLPIASVCHGPVAFLSPRESTGQSPFEGYRMTAFSHAEEFFTPINGKLPIVLELELKRLGIHYSKSPVAWGAHVVVDRNVVTGQNPYSSEAVGHAFIELLSRR